MIRSMSSPLAVSMVQARHGGAESLLLEVRPSNAPALRLYRNFGFQEVGRRKGYYPASTGREDALVMRKSLVEVVL